jgi:transcriptional regulator of acetoin/glycerol metabolism
VSYEWPGNVRELRNVIERVMILDDKERIDIEDLPARIVRRDLGDGDGDGGVHVPVGSMTLEEMERDAIRQALERANHNQVQAARLLGISRDTLRYRMKKFGLLDSSP